MIQTTFAHRKHNRLPHFNYSDSGYYYVTICTHNKIPFFGRVVNRKMVCNECGNIVSKQWSWLEKQYLYVKSYEFIVMPNHIHGIIVINRAYICVGNGRDRSLHNQDHQKVKSLSELMGAFKTTSSKIIHQTGLKHFTWQKSFYDHIIRSETELLHIQKYIRYNPLKWGDDEYYNPNDLE